MEGGLDYMEKLINTIIESVKEKKVQSYGKKILKKCSFKSKNDLSNIVIFATWLYIYGYNEYAMQVCDLLSDVSFNGNYDLWNNADYAACLKARILRENSVEDGRAELLRRVNEHREPELYHNTVDYYRNTINLNIESDDKYHPGKITDFWRINKLIKAIEYREAGGYPVSDEELEKDIEELIVDLRKIAK